MSESKDQAEPTMEEILASIRRIISEDDPEGTAETDGEEAEPAPEAEPEPESQSQDDSDEVLDLTQKVNEDGTVVDLAAARAEEEEKEDASEEISQADLDAMFDSPAGEEPAVEEPAEEETVAPEPADQDDIDAMFAAEPEPDIEPAQEPAPEPAPDFDAEAESLLAPETQEAAAGALGELVEAAARERKDVRIGDGRTLEQIVREALAPELKAWLDANLAPLVEQIVREEVKKLARRVADE